MAMVATEAAMVVGKEAVVRVVAMVEGTAVVVRAAAATVEGTGVAMVAATAVVVMAVAATAARVAARVEGTAVVVRAAAATVEGTGVAAAVARVEEAMAVALAVEAVTKEAAAVLVPVALEGTGAAPPATEHGSAPAARPRRRGATWRKVGRGPRKFGRYSTFGRYAIEFIKRQPYLPLFTECLDRSSSLQPRVLSCVSQPPPACPVRPLTNSPKRRQR